MDENVCSECGEFTSRRGPFGELLCSPCHRAQDEAIEQVERRDARRFGYQYGWSEDQPK